jgi:hypothetical protein
MLSKEALAYLATCTYRSDAKREINLIPLSGIYWEDEFPVFGGKDLVPEDDYWQIMRLFKIRSALWRGERLPEETQEFWDDVRARLPQWALFQRMNVTEEDLQADVFAVKAMDDFEAEVEAELAEDEASNHRAPNASNMPTAQEEDQHEEQPDEDSSIQ